MVSTFVIYDLVFLVVFSLAVVVFLYIRRRNLQRQGLLYLYRTKIGIKFIEWTGNKFPKTLKALQYFVVASGHILMISMTYLIVRFSYFYITSDVAAKALKVPVIVPLVPYLPDIFNIDFLPPFYFTYWIIIIAIIAIPHEFAHGIFASLNKIKIHSTGFGFLGPFLAAFVEPDEKQMEKTSKFTQLSVLASGTFANVLFTVIFGIIFWLFFVSAFTPAGVMFQSYATVRAPISAIDKINGTLVNSPTEISGLLDLNESFVKFEIANTSLFASLAQLKTLAEEGGDKDVTLILDSPAFRAKLAGAISEINGEKITSLDDLIKVINSNSPGDNVTIKTILSSREEKEYVIQLANFSGRPFLGIGVPNTEREGLLGWIYKLITKIKDPFVYYQSGLGDFGWFIYNLLWWTVLVSLSVALVNMLPVGIFDGGRFFFLTVWGITGSKKAGEVAYKISTYIILLIIAVLMVKYLLVLPQIFN